MIDASLDAACDAAWMSEVALPFDLPLARGEHAVWSHVYEFQAERMTLFVFGLLLAPVLVGLPLLYWAWRFRAFFPRAHALTNQRLLEWSATGELRALSLPQVSRVLPASDRDWVALLASGGASRARLGAGLWERATGVVVFVEDSSETWRLPQRQAAYLGPRLAENIRFVPPPSSRPVEVEQLRAHYVRGVFTVPLGQEAALREAEHGGKTLLHLAQRASTVKALLALGLDPNARDTEGRTPLAYAKEADATELLIGAGANVHAVDPSGRGLIVLLIHHPLDAYVVGYCAPDFAALDVLLKAGAAAPTVSQARTWIAEGARRVNSAGEALDHDHFVRWIWGVVR